MNTVRGSTASETKMIKAIQRAVGAAEDGLIGTATMSGLAAKVGAACFPLNLTIYGQPTIIANDILPIASPGKGLAAFAHSINGSFYYQGKPCSICVAGGEVKSATACHGWLGKPETVLYKRGGYIYARRCKSAADLPSGVQWAVGGMGLGNYYDPEAEGFSGKYADVLRKTNHSMLGCKGGKLYLVYCKGMTGAQVDAHARKLGLELAIMMDGGHIAGINTTHAKINTGITQYYVVQGI